MTWYEWFITGFTGGVIGMLVAAAFAAAHVMRNPQWMVKRMLGMRKKGRKTSPSMIPMPGGEVTRSTHLK